MITLKIYSTVEMLEHIKTFPVRLVRLADNFSCEVTDTEGLLVAATRFYENGNTCVARVN